MASRFQLSIPEPRRRDGWFRMGNIDVTTTALLSGLSVVGMFVYAISRTLFDTLVFLPWKVRDGQLWRVVTWPIANQPSIWLLIGIVFFWIFGHQVEELVGRVRFTVLVAAATIVPALVVSLIGDFYTTAIPLLGIGFLGTLMLVLFAADRPNAPFFFGIPAWIIALVFIGIDVLQFTADRLWGTLIQLVLMLGIGLVMFRHWGHASDLTFIPSFGQAGAPGSQKPKAKQKQRKQGRDFDRVVTAGPWTGPSGADQAEMDRLLDKMNSVGLSDVERKRLSELGKRLRGN